MSIVCCAETGLITIHTDHTSYQMKADEIGTLLHTYYGPRVGDEDLSYAIFRMNRGFSGNQGHPAKKNGRSRKNDRISRLFFKARFHFPPHGVYYVIAFFSQNWS